MNKDDYFEIGYIGKPHGYKGFLHIIITSDDEIVFNKLTFVVVEINNLLTPFFIEKLDANQKVIVKLENIHTDTEAKKLQSKKLFVSKDSVIISEQASDWQYIGYEIIDHYKGNLGKILRIEEMPANDVFIITYKGKEVILPINEDFIDEIDDTHKTIKYKAPNGLIELYLE